MSNKMEHPEVTALRAKASVERCVRLASQVRLAPPRVPNVNAVLMQCGIIIMCLCSCIDYCIHVKWPEVTALRLQVIVESGQRHQWSAACASQMGSALPRVALFMQCCIQHITMMHLCYHVHWCNNAIDFCGAACCDIVEGKGFSRALRAPCIPGDKALPFWSRRNKA